MNKRGKPERGKPIGPCSNCKWWVYKYIYIHIYYDIGRYVIWDIHNTMISYYIIAFCSYYAYRIWDVSYYIVIPKMYQENIRVDAYDIWFRVGRLQKNISQWYTHMGYRNTSMILLDYYIMIYIYEYIYIWYIKIYIFEYYLDTWISYTITVTYHPHVEITQLDDPQALFGSRQGDASYQPPNHQQIISNANHQPWWNHQFIISWWLSNHH